MGVVVERRKGRTRVLWNGLARHEVVGIRKKGSDSWEVLLKDGGKVVTDNRHLASVIEKKLGEGGL